MIVDHKLRQPETFSNKYAQHIIFNETLNIPESSNPFLQ